MNSGAEPATPHTPHRILITADAVGGVWQYTVDLVQCLLSSGVTIMVATMGPLPSEQQRAQLPPGTQLISSEYALEWGANPWNDVDKAGGWLLGLRDAFRPDLVHLNGYAHAVLPWNCPVVVVAHSCVFSWWRAVHREAPGPGWDEYRLRVCRGLLACDAIVSPSAFMARELTDLYQVPASKITTIHNFSSTGAAEPTVKEPFCLAAGRVWDEGKNFRLLPEVAQHIAWPIYLAGADGSSSLPAVKTLGSVPHDGLADWMRRARIFLHPAVYEPFGLAILEAARAACCLVLSDTASAHELWAGAALFADPSNPSDWVKAVSDLIADRDECERLGQAARQHSRRYSQERFRDSYSKLYNALLQRRKNPNEAAA